VWFTGHGPLFDGLRAVDGGVLLVGALLALPITVACACRWTAVARAVGAELRLAPAVAAYYRSQFLNSTLPGGVIGDVHRGLRHGRDTGRPGRGLGAVVGERFAGQAVQLVVTLLVLLVLPSPIPHVVPVAAAGILGLLLVLVLVHTSGHATLVRFVRGHTWVVVAGASVCAVAGHVATYLVAARAAGVDAPPGRLVPLALLALLAMALPVHLAGWGPREGVAAWSFGAAGLGAGQGLETSVVYGVMVLVASLPGAVVLIGERRRPAHRRQAAERQAEVTLG
jgi:uncharacterized membrane protein YbhN (UPF0104 family)